MLGIVLPTVAGAAIAAVVDAIPLEIIVHVDVDVVVTPSGSVAPPAPGRADGQPHPERDRAGCYDGTCRVRRVVNRGVRVHRSSINDGGIVGWYIDHVRLRRLHNDHRFVFYNLVFDCHLLVGLQGALILGDLSHTLYSFHNVALLGKKSVAKVRRPLNIVREPFHNIRQGCHGLNTWIPGLLRYGIGQRLVFKIGIPCHPLLKLHDFQRVCGCNQHLAQQRVRVKGNGSHQRIQLIGRKHRICRMGSRSCRCRAWAGRRVLILRSKSQSIPGYQEHREQYGEETPISLEGKSGSRDIKLHDVFRLSPLGAFPAELRPRETQAFHNF